MKRPSGLGNGHGARNRRQIFARGAAAFGVKLHTGYVVALDGRDDAVSAVFDLGEDVGLIPRPRGAGSARNRTPIARARYRPGCRFPAVVVRPDGRQQLRPADMRHPERGARLGDVRNSIDDAVEESDPGVIAELGAPFHEHLHSHADRGTGGRSGRRSGPARPWSPPKLLDRAAEAPTPGRTRRSARAILR